MALTLRLAGRLCVLAMVFISWTTLFAGTVGKTTTVTDVGGADTVVPPQLSLTRDQAVQRALKFNPNVYVSDRQLAMARARRLQAGGLDAPTIFWEWEEVNHFRPSRFGNQVFGIEQSFKWFGVRRSHKQAADLEITIAQANMARIRQRIIAQVNKAFDLVLFAKANVALVRQTLGRTEEAVVISRARFRSGKAQYLDVLRTRIVHQRLQNILRETVLAEARARRRLNLLLGRPADAPLAVSGKLDFQPRQQKTAIVLAQAVQSGPTFVLLQRRVERGHLDYRIQRKNRAPEITLGLGRQRLYDGANADYAWAGQLSLKFPFPGSNQQRGREQEARARAQAIRYRAQALMARARARLRQRVEEANSLVLQMNSFLQKTLLDADDQIKAARQAYRVRRIDALNLMDVYRTYLETRRHYLKLLVRYRAAWIDIQTYGEDLWEIE